MNRCKYEWMNKWTDGHMYGWNSQEELTKNY